MNKPGGPPFFSVVTVVYNDLPGLRLTLESVTSQECDSFEWIVVDGKSTDGTVELLESLDLACLKFTSGRDKGIYDAMNKGTAECTGRYVVYMNAGDVFGDATTLRQVQDRLEASGHPELLFGGCNYLFENGTTRYRAPRRMETAIWHGQPGKHQSTYFRRDSLDSPPYSLGYSVSSDYFIMARQYKKGARACYLDVPLANFAVGGVSTTKANTSMLQMWRIQRDVLGSNLIFRLASICRCFAAQRAVALLHRLKKARRAGV